MSNYFDQLLLMKTDNFALGFYLYYRISNVTEDLTSLLWSLGICNLYDNSVPSVTTAAAAAAAVPVWLDCYRCQAVTVCLRRACRPSLS